jgi:hypothetical protein
MKIKTRQNEEYYLAWTRNPDTWNENLKDLIKSGRVEKVGGRYYTRVIAHYTGTFSIIDCTCNKKSGDFYPINTSNLKEIW